MNSHAYEVGSGADAPLGVVKIDQMGPGLPADDHPGLVLLLGKGGGDAHRCAGKRHHPRTGPSRGEA